ncbi:MAG: hypothetical protein ACTSPB_03200 [Candidatus Thorarchaeota archaeon]
MKPKLDKDGLVRGHCPACGRKQDDKRNKKSGNAWRHRDEEVDGVTHRWMYYVCVFCGANLGLPEILVGRWKR